MKIQKTILTLVVIAVGSICVPAQSPLQFAVYDKGSGILEIVFSETIRTGQLPTHILLINTATGEAKKVPVEQVNIKRRFATLDHADLGGFLDISLAAEPVMAFIPFRSDPNKADTKIVSVAIREMEATNPELEKEAPKGRDDAELYLSGEIVAAEGSKPVYSVDAKYEKLTAFGTSPFRVGGFVSLKANTSPKADPDQFRIGAKFAATKFVGARDDRCDLLCVVWWEGTAELEADKEFKVKNFITAQRVKFLPRNMLLSKQKDEQGFEIPVPRRTALRFMPFIGGDLGSNLTSPVPRSEKGIARIVGGASLELYVPKSPLTKLGFESVSWENTFTQRWFLKPEMVYDKDPSGDLVLNSFGRKPRSHFISKFNLMITEFFGPTISYEWGEQPPVFTKIRHRLKFGFTYAYRQKKAK